MNNNYTQRLEMQIPYESTWTESIKSTFDDDFKKLSSHYTIHDSTNVKSFIKKHEAILTFIHDLTPLLNTYFPNYPKIIEFCEDPEFNDLSFIMIYINGNSFEKDYDTLEKFKKEPLYMSKFAKKINGLVCVGLW